MEIKNDNYIERNLVHYTLEEYLRSENVDTPNLIINILDPNDKKNGHFVDLGELLYEDKYYIPSHIKNMSYYKVNPSSFVKHWEPFIYKLNEYVALRRKTIRSKISIYTLTRRALLLVSEVGLSNDFFKSKIDTKLAYRIIINELKHRMQVGDITPRNADILQNNLATIAEIYYGRSFRNYMVADNINIKGCIESTLLREVDDLKHAYDVYYNIATQLTEHLVCEKSLPFLIKTEKYETYLFPSASHRVTPYCNRPTKAYNDVEGRLSTFEELRYKTDPRIKDSYVRSDLYSLRKRFNKINSDPRAKCKRALASTAMQAYQTIFMMLTGAYISEVDRLEFCDNYEYSTSTISKSYRVVKFRASGRIVQYDLSTG
ncbi:hypothetical protein [Vibrio sp. Vb339]|uniref:hypothetical protein n=1 Tax=Vibrio sp. Vb339 TaxID=1192013 RepID=UPI001552C09F|nr:hypothetical protein [Vibrio sp. Vb339]